MTWINREAEQELRKWLDRSAGEIPMRPGRFVTAGMLTEFLDSMHVINAGDDEAEKALDACEKMIRAADGVMVSFGNVGMKHTRADALLATIRARLRAARASHTPEELEDVILAVCWLAEERGLSRDPECRMALDRIGDFLRGLRPEPAAKPKETQG